MREGRAMTIEISAVARVPPVAQGQVKNIRPGRALPARLATFAEFAPA
jgi:hypothetical protein